MVRNRSQLNTNLNSEIFGSAISFAGEGAVMGSEFGPLGAALGGAIGLIGGLLFGEMRSTSRLNAQLAKIQDLKNTPNKLNTNGGKINGDLTMSDLDVKLVYYELPYNEKKQIQNHFMQFGVNFSNALYNINDVINSRYYFNYIKAPGTFENISLNCAEEVKEIINNTLAYGVTIWHVRDIKTFKGIKNYSYDNLEMALFNENKNIF